ncbi:unknown [Clostridium sp. CAG:567]|nr:unknown [Clostridium sp. CAG:567]
MLSSNPKYQKYKQYFRKWINDQYAKKEEIQKRGKREDEQERD